MIFTFELDTENDPADINVEVESICNAYFGTKHDMMEVDVQIGAHSMRAECELVDGVWKCTNIKMYKETTNKAKSNVAQKLQTRELCTLFNIPLAYVVEIKDRGTVEYDLPNGEVETDDLRLVIMLSGGTPFVVQDGDALCISEDGKILEVCRWMPRDDDE